MEGLLQLTAFLAVENIFVGFFGICNTTRITPRSQVPAWVFHTSLRCERVNFIDRQLAMGTADLSDTLIDCHWGVTGEDQMSLGCIKIGTYHSK